MCVCVCVVCVCVCVFVCMCVCMCVCVCVCVWCAIECIPDLLLVVLFPLLPGLGGCGGGAVLQCTSGDSCTTVELGEVSMPCTCPSERKPSNFYKINNF